MTPSPTRSRARRGLSFAAAAGAVVATLTAYSGAEAVGPCPGASIPADYAAPTDPTLNFWEFEGKITAVDEAARTITVNGATFHLPEGQLIKTQGLDQTTGNLSLADLMNPPDPVNQPSVVGSATVIASGQAVYSTTTEGQQCVSFEAASTYVEWAENVLVGVLTGVDPNGQFLVVAGTTVTMNTDARFPANVVDATGPIALADFAGKEGLLIEAEGYFRDGALRATHVGTDEILKPPPANSDIVTIGRAQWKQRELRVNGQVSPVGTGKTVGIYGGGLTEAGDCDTTRSLGSAAVLADGSYSLRNRNVATNPGTICAKSSGGGVTTAAVQAG